MLQLSHGASLGSGRRKDQGVVAEGQALWRGGTIPIGAKAPD